jgi:hypothetical protein
MPIQINEVETQVDVQAPGSAQETPSTKAALEALARWQEMARRGSQLAERTAAWNFDD